jgi:dephospho-CoA kinase
MFARRGAPIIDADVIGRELVLPGQPALAEIAHVFGPGLIDASGQLDRTRLRSLVFQDAAARHRLEAILHPRIRDAIQARLQQLAAPYCIIVVPLLVETRFEDLVDRVLVIDAEKKHQINRTMARDRLPLETVEKILAAQVGRSQRLARADDVIANNGNLDQLEREVTRLDANYRALSGGV